jgi:hypothetical protein
MSEFPVLKIARIATGRRATNTTVQPKNITFATDAKRSTPGFSPAIPTTGTLAAGCAGVGGDDRGLTPNS